MGFAWKSTLNLLPELLAALPKVAEATVLDVAQAIAKDAQAIVPVDTGALQESIEASQVNDRTAVVDVGKDYGIFVEYGTVKMAAQPFMTPACEYAFTTFGDHFRTHMRKAAF